MSYSIIYDKLFVSLSNDKVIPFILSGDNNVWEASNNKRARSFSVWNTGVKDGEFVVSKQDLMVNVINEVERMVSNRITPTESENEIKKSFGYYTGLYIRGNRKTSAGNFIGVFKSGIKNAVSFDTLNDLGIYLRFTYSSFYNDDGEPTIEPPKFELIGGEEKFYAELEKAQHFIKNCKYIVDGKVINKTPYVYLTIDMHYDSVLYRIKRLKKQKRRDEFELVSQDYSYVLHDGNGNSLLKYTARGFRYAWTETGGKRFRTEEQAEKYRKSLVYRKMYMCDKWKVKKIEHPHCPYSFKVNKKVLDK